MSETATSPQTDQSIFECTVCGARRATRALRYNRLGYAICPVCTHHHGP